MDYSRTFASLVGLYSEDSIGLVEEGAFSPRDSRRFVVRRHEHNFDEGVFENECLRIGPVDLQEHALFLLALGTELLLALQFRGVLVDDEILGVHAR